ncbi:unnamed protein product [Rotaria sp. Silwood1]|nr:unnamed protein product [Rotaria sp. Silwood1]
MFYRWLKQSERTFPNPESFPCCLSTVSDKENTLVKEQKEFEKSLFTKTCKGSEDVILLDNLTIAYRNNVDLFFNVVDSTNENEPLASLSIFHPTFRGLCNNFGYVVMLSAAHDILKQEESDNSTQPVSHNTTNQFDCNPISTGTILLADILPALVIKITAAFFMHKILYNIRFVLIVLFAAGALIIVSISKVIALSIFGVVCASISAGFGEITMLQLTSFYEKYTVSAWSSGTGAASLLGALSYAGLTSLLKLSPRTAILILLFIPVLQVISYIMVGASQTAAKHREYQQISSHIVLIRR